jgi:hypothetical protein
MKGYALQIRWVGHDATGEWVASAVPEDRTKPVLEGGAGPTRLAAATCAQQTLRAMWESRR